MQETPMNRNVEIRMRHWVYVDGVKFFGPGRLELLVRIAETGSMAKAAKDMGMSYKKAWAMVDEMNALGQNPYVVARKGGQKGGGTELTETGRKVIEAYKELNRKLMKVVEAESELLQLI
ncbi:hypothetical protein DYBT9275_02135 [Dyadobacter sp. CECT 9275]|uniref:HTH lysR-type domain-containing protein n=1 Tax=Dyadobacter helix TaxID=2822344 RepID=A0A916NBN2_9BACT|nr:winged helix-turn-helix domain-containing protein [Dyadobacter sp. CECT 9275]CAG4999028.1 hypothetical protein DYBT9275_02135 [Dyadobacter sp. CECT 9275]